MLQGAANKSVPETKTVTVKDQEGSPVDVSKYDVIYACHVVCKHKFIRRLAEALAMEIGMFAEAHHLNGDLAIKLNTALTKEGKTPLSSKEKAWASSFSQSFSKLEKYAGIRVPALLATDYQNRFNNKEINTSTGIRTSGSQKSKNKQVKQNQTKNKKDKK